MREPRRRRRVRSPHVTVRFWGLGVWLLAFGALAIGAAARWDDLPPRVPFVVIAARGGSAGFVVDTPWVPLVIAVPAVALAVLGAFGVAAWRRSRRKSQALAVTTGMVTVVVVVQLGLCLLVAADRTPDVWYGGIHVVALASTFFSAWLFMPFYRLRGELVDAEVLVGDHLAGPGS